MVPMMNRTDQEKKEVQNKYHNVLKTLKENGFSFPSGWYQKYLPQYWSEIFRPELEYVCNHRESVKTRCDIPKEPIMLLTVGATPEPLVLAIHLVQPETIFALYNHPSHLKSLQDGLEKAQCVIKGVAFKDCLKPIQLPEKTDNLGEAAMVFRLLRGRSPGTSNNCEKKNLEELLGILDDEGKRQKIVFDITGAKKTISGGCLLFAAYYDLPIYYMDFSADPDDYDPDLGRPKPGACFYTRQSNPISGFRLKDFQNIERAFNEHRFHDVEVLLGPIVKSMDKDPDGYFSQEEINFYKELLSLNQVYHDWQAGWYGDVFEQKNNLHAEVQEWIAKLSRYPKKKAWKQPAYDAEFYEDEDAFLSFAIMELAVLCRGKETSPPRHLFLRAFGLEEVMLGYLLFKLFRNDEINYSVCNSIKNLPDDVLLCYAISQSYGAWEAFLLGKNHNIKIEVFGPKGPQKEMIRKKFPEANINEWYYKKQKVCISTFKNYELPEEINSNLQYFSNNRQMRNKATHAIQPITRQDAQKAVDALEKLLKAIVNEDFYWDKTDGMRKKAQDMLANNNWFQEKEVAPLAWKDIHDEKYPKS